MLQIRRILQLLSKGETPYAISKELCMSKNTVKAYYERLKLSGLTWERLQELDDNSLSEIAYITKQAASESPRLSTLKSLLPGYLKRLKSTHSTRETLWGEYRKLHPDGYGYSQFCEHLSRHTKQNEAVMRMVHQPANELQIDFAGDALKYINRNTGELISCPVLVCTLPFSGYTYVEALPDMKQARLIGALNRCLFFLGGVPWNISSDNLKQVVTKADKYEPKFTESMNWFALHYNTSLHATRVLKPKDKAMVERHVGIVYTRIYSIVEQVEYYSLEELNRAIIKQLHLFNAAKLQRKEHSRKDLFEEKEKPLLQALPKEEFETKHKTTAKVQKNYHIILGEDWHNYSVPYKYIGQKVDVVYDTQNVEIYKDIKRIAIHKRNFAKHQYTTIEEHMPENHKISKQIGGYTPDCFLEKGKEIGGSVHELMETVINNKFFSQQTFKSCLGILRLANKYGSERLEKASRMALDSHKANYNTVKNILKNNRDKLNNRGPTEKPVTANAHDNIRGSGFYTKLFSEISGN